MTEAAHARLDALYAELPRIACLGRCGVLYCGSIDMTPIERRRIRDTSGLTINRLPEGPQMCPALGPLGTCTVYEVRPAVCRVWGIMRSTRCRFGCMPEGGFWGDMKGLRWLLAVEVAGGGTTQQEAERRLAFMRTPRGQQIALGELIKGMVKSLNRWERHHGRRRTERELLDMILMEVSVDH